MNGDASVVGDVGNRVGNVGNRVGNLRQQGALTARVALAAYGKLSVDDSQARYHSYCGVSKCMARVRSCIAMPQRADAVMKRGML